jgi:hypothetical protein
VTTKKAKKIRLNDLKDKFTIGVLADVEKPIYTDEYHKIRQQAKGLAGKSKQ